MLISRAFPSAYIKAEDLDDKNHCLIMDRVKVEEVGDDTKPVLYFRGAKKGLALNVTNAKTIAAAYGEETDDWMGQELILFPTVTEFQGRTTPCIRVRAPQPKDRPREAAATTRVATNGNGGSRLPAARAELSDAVPF
jgi:hypothetical protein